MDKAVYPGTFDPITNGHIDIIKRSKKFVSHLVVLVIKHPEKEPLFTVEERVYFIKEAIKEIKGVEIDSFDGLLMNYVAKKGIELVIRGLRAVSDFDYELQLTQFNRKLNPKVETIFVMPSEEYFFLSSSMVKEIASYGGEIRQFVPQVVVEGLRRKLKNGKS